MIWGVTRGPDDVDLETTGLWWGIASSALAIAGVAAVAWNAPGETDRPARTLRVGTAMGWVAALGGAQVVVLVVPVAIAFEDLAFIPLGSAIGCGLGGLVAIMVLAMVAAAWGVWALLDGASVIERASMGLILLGVVVIALGLALGSDLESHGIWTIVPAILALFGGHTTDSRWMAVARVAAVADVILLGVMARAFRRREPRA